MLRGAKYQLRKVWRRYLYERRLHPSLVSAPSAESEEFLQRFRRNREDCDWQPHPRYSVFTQYDGRYYTALRAEYLQKYRSFWAVSRTIRPTQIIELGTQAGSGADAYLNATPEADYTGIDLFGEGTHDELTGAPWHPRAIAQDLLSGQGFSFNLIKADLRGLSSLPSKADLVVVDAAHDVENEYGDLRLALTANPQWIFVDDAADWKNAGLAIARFLARDVKDRLAYTVPIDYIDMGLLLRLKDPAG